MTSIGEFDLETVDRLLTTTRAVRKRLDFDHPVERAVILDCLRIATQAPSGGNSQPWRWIVVDDPALCTRLGELYLQAYVPYVEAQEAIVAAREGAVTERMRAMKSSSDYLAEQMWRAPALVLPCLLRPLPERGTAADYAVLYGSVMPAIWSFMLALRSRGLGSSLTTVHLHKADEVAAILGIPEGVTQVAMIPVGYTLGGDFRPAVRKPVEDATAWNGWA